MFLTERKHTVWIKGICINDCENVEHAMIFQRPVLKLATLCNDHYTRSAGIMQQINMPLPRHVSTKARDLLYVHTHVDTM